MTSQNQGYLFFLNTIPESEKTWEGILCSETHIPGQAALIPCPWVMLPGLKLDQ